MIKIGITSGWGNLVDGWPLVYTNKGIVDALEQAGALPVIFPVLNDVNVAKAIHYVNMVDAVIVSGEVTSIGRNVIANGGDDPLKNSNPLRYRNERAIIRAAVDNNIPLLGICRGMQILVVEEGGTMNLGEISYSSNGAGHPVIHQQGLQVPPDTPVHHIRIEQGSKLHELLGSDNLMVNSFHRQSVGTVPDGYRVSATTADGTVEAVEAVDDRLIIGVQFHPEMLRGTEWDNFFTKFVNKIADYIK